MIDENSTFGGFLTSIGEAKQANANALEMPWKLTHMLLGDANGNDPTPDPDQTQLINQRYRAGINQLFVDPQNDAILVAELVLPPNVGGWWIRELGIEDEDGDFVAVANCAPSYKPLLAQGSGRNQVVRMHLILSNTANVELKVDPSVVLATRKYADDGDTATAQTAATALQQHAESRNHPPATTTALGFVKKATTAEAKSGAPDKFPDAAAMKAAITAAGYQFANYDPDRTYETGEVTRGSDGQFYEFYDRDLAGTVQGVDPTVSANRPHIWMNWDGNRPGQTIEWRSETLPEGYIVNDGDDYSRTDYRRIFAAWGTTYGVGDGSTTFGSPDDRGEFKRGWDNGRGVDSGRELSAGQSDQFKSHSHGSNNAMFSNSNVDVGSGSNVRGVNNSSVSSTASAGGSETRPRNNAVIWLTKI